MNRSRIAAAFAAVALALITLTGCPVVATDGEEDDEGGEEDHITFVISR